MSEEDYAQFIGNLIEIQNKKIPLFFYKRDSKELEKIELKVLTQIQKDQLLKSKFKVEIPKGPVSLADFDFSVPQKQVHEFDLSDKTIMKQLFQGSFELHKTESSKFVVTGHLCQQLLTLRLSSDAL